MSLRPNKERQMDLKTRRRESGMVRVEFWVMPNEALRLKEFLKEIRGIK